MAAAVAATTKLHDPDVVVGGCRGQGNGRFGPNPSRKSVLFHRAPPRVAHARVACSPHPTRSASNGSARRSWFSLGLLVSSAGLLFILEGTVGRARHAGGRARPGARQRALLQRSSAFRQAHGEWRFCFRSRSASSLLPRGCPPAARCSRSRSSSSGPTLTAAFRSGSCCSPSLGSTPTRIVASAWGRSSLRCSLPRSTPAAFHSTASFFATRSATPGFTA